MNRTSLPQPAQWRRQRGASLIEVMVALLVLTVSMLGVAATQATALRNNQSSLERSQAVIASYSILDAMRANPTAARNNAYNMELTCSAPTGTGRIAVDQARWINSLKADVGSAACGAINCSNGVCTVTVRWDESRALAGSSTQSLTTVSRI